MQSLVLLYKWKWNGMVTNFCVRWRWNELLQDGWDESGTGQEWVGNKIICARTGGYGCDFCSTREQISNHDYSDS